MFLSSEVRTMEDDGGGRAEDADKKQRGALNDFLSTLAGPHFTLSLKTLFVAPATRFVMRRSERVDESRKTRAEATRDQGGGGKMLIMMLIKSF